MTTDDDPQIYRTLLRVRAVLTELNQHQWHPDRTRALALLNTFVHSRDALRSEEVQALVDFARQIEASSLGTDAARRLRNQTTPGSVGAVLRQVDARLNAAATRDTTRQTELTRQLARASVGAGPESAGVPPDLATVRAVLDNVRQELDAIAFAPTQPVDTMSTVPVVPVVTTRPDRRRLKKAGVAEVVSAAIDGERHAVAELLTRVRPIVVRYCRVRLGGTGLGSFKAADDVAQEVCVIVLDALSRYRDKPETFLAFVYGVAAHKVVDHRRRSAASALPSDGPDDVPSDDVRQYDAARPAGEPAATDLAARLNDLLDALSPVQREVVMLRIIVGLSADETATALGITPGAVRVNQHRALARLRKSLDTSEHIRAD